MQPQFASPADDGRGIEIGTFKEDVSGLLGDRARQPAHHAAQRQRTGLVRDQQETLAHRDLVFGQQGQLLAFFGAPHDDVAGQLFEIEGVHRLAQFEQHVVGDIDGRADRPQSTAAQSFGHPLRGICSRIDVADDAADVTRAIAGRVESDGLLVVTFRGNGPLLRQTQLAPEDRSNLLGEADHAQAVGPIGGQIDLDALIVEVQEVAQAVPDWCIFRQLEQTGSIFADAQFGRRTEHALGLDAAQFGRFDLELARKHRADLCKRSNQTRSRIRCAADNLLELPAAVLHLAQAQLVGVGMRLALRDAPDHDAGERGRCRLHRVDLETGHGEPVDQFFRGDPGEVHPFPEPFFAEFHCLISILRLRAVWSIKAEP